MALNINPVNWFEIPVSDMKRAKTFYENIFDIEITLNHMDNLQMGWFPSAQAESGATGTLIKAETYVPSYNGSMVYFSVDDIEAVLDKVPQHGGSVLNDKQSIGEYGFIGHFEDSEGNRIGLHSVD